MTRETLYFDQLVCIMKPNQSVLRSRLHTPAARRKGPPTSIYNDSDACRGDQRGRLEGLHPDDIGVLVNTRITLARISVDPGMVRLWYRPCEHHQRPVVQWHQQREEILCRPSVIHVYDHRDSISAGIKRSETMCLRLVFVVREVFGSKLANLRATGG